MSNGFFQDTRGIQYIFANQSYNYVKLASQVLHKGLLARNERSLAIQYLRTDDSRLWFWTDNKICDLVFGHNLLIIWCNPIYSSPLVLTPSFAHSRFLLAALKGLSSLNVNLTDGRNLFFCNDGWMTDGFGNSFSGSHDGHGSESWVGAKFQAMCV